MLRGQPFSGSVSFITSLRSGRKAFKDLAKGAGKTLSRGQWVAYAHILVIKST